MPRSITSGPVNRGFRPDFLGVPLIPIITGAPVAGEYVEIGLLVPATAGPEAAEHDAFCVRLDHQVPAEGDGGRIGILVCDGRHLVADVVSPH